MNMALVPYSAHDPGHPKMERHVLSCFFQVPFCTPLRCPDFPTGYLKWRNGSAKLMFGHKEGSLFLKASKRKLQNKGHWTHILTMYWWNWRALHFKSTSVRYCKIINKGFSYISCALFTEKENHIHIKPKSLSSPKPALSRIILR